MNRFTAVLATAFVLALTVVPVAQADFGIQNLDVGFENEDGSPATQAGSHPFAVTTDFAVNTIIHPEFGKVPDEELKTLRVALPAGFTGSPLATPKCATADFLTQDDSGQLACPDSTAVGAATALFGDPDNDIAGPAYNLVPPPGVVARIGFFVYQVPVTIEVGVSPAPPYNVASGLVNVSQAVEVYGGSLTLWGDPADPAHDSLRGHCLSKTIPPEGGYLSDGICPTNTPKIPFLVMPRSCTGPLETVFEAISWQSPFAPPVVGSVLSHDDAEPPNPQGETGCSKLGFSPTVDSKATTSQAESGSGLDFRVDFQDEGLMNPSGLAQSDIKKAVVSLPEGMTVNPSVAEGLDVCPPAQLDRETVHSAPGEGCPNASRLGTVQVKTPLVEEAIDGSVFLAQQDDPATSTPGAENPFDSLLAFYIVLKNPNLGVMVKLPARIDPDPRTGQLVTTLDDTPQVPFSSFDFHFREGARAPLVTPPSCDSNPATAELDPYTTVAEFTPWANPADVLTTTSSFKITSGVGGGPCPPGGVPPFKPQFEAGAVNNNAGSFSPFNMRLIRSDGEQDMTKFSAVLPPGQLGSLAGVGKCPDAAVDIAKSKTGRQELASPSCPANSLIGHTLAGAGVGGALTYVGGQIYLAGPYKGAPLSVISITPAVAGPFDAGTVVVRLGLDLNPKTAEVEVDGAASDPIPHILKGIVLKVRDLRVYVDRSNFTLNPTSCDESKVRATLFGSYLDVFSPADDVPVDLATRYQAANCLNLGFKPKLDFKLKGGTKRGGHPGLTATYTPRKGDANVKGLVVRLPRSAFLDQGHIRTICTRVQFAADACPQGAQYGFIKAFTPLLDEPLEGPVYLRSSTHKLPDLVFDLHGLVDVEVATRIDSVNGGIRATIEDAPDAPLSKVVLQMQGAKKGLIINSRNLCGAKYRADVRVVGHNGKELNVNPVMRADCGKGRKRLR
ncbi:MAG TPA: hypothetical protein VK471_00945 [Solirubrobacterales bacterium]|nr:hypothetical protein [Solirubrobacterales bacterium]